MSQPQNLVALKRAKDRAIDLLSQRFAEGVIDNAILETRMDKIHSANDVAQIDALITDLADPDTQTGQALVAGNVSQALVTKQSPHKITAILSATTRTGRWTPAAVNIVRSILGGTQIDFRQAVLPTGGIDVHVTAILGGVSITVPADVIVENNIVGFLGGVEIRGTAATHLDASQATRIRLHGVACLGGVEVHIKERE